jgi:hypothetical protein
MPALPASRRRRMSHTPSAWTSVARGAGCGHHGQTFPKHTGLACCAPRRGRAWVSGRCSWASGPRRSMPGRPRSSCSPPSWRSTPGAMRRRTRGFARDDGRPLWYFCGDAAPSDPTLARCSQCRQQDLDMPPAEGPRVGALRHRGQPLLAPRQVGMRRSAGFLAWHQKNVFKAPGRPLSGFDPGMSAIAFSGALRSVNPPWHPTP